MIPASRFLRSKDDGLGNGSAARPGEASCNTPPSVHLNRLGTCIDYLKFTFPHGYLRERALFSSLFELMCVDESSSESLRSMHGFTDVMRIAPGTNVAFGGTMTNRKSGEETTMLEMSGEGCRDFEDRYFSRRFMEDDSIDRSETVRDGWISLIEKCLSMDGECKRVDVPTDDFSGGITVSEIKEKVANHHYSTELRALEVTDERGKEELKDVKTVKDSKLSGYSATFGTRKSLQLCIYDKLAERMAAGIDPKVDSWIRFEVRFYHDRAGQEIQKLLKALKCKTESSHIVGCLSSIIDFKEESGMSERHRSKAETWSKWTELAKSGTGSIGFAVAPRVMSIESNASWLVREGGKSFLRILAALDGSDFATLGSALGLKAVNKLTKADLQNVNQYRKSVGQTEFGTLDDLKRYLLTIPDLVVDFDEQITKLIFDKRSKKDIQKAIEQRKLLKDGEK